MSKIDRSFHERLSHASYDRLAFDQRTVQHMSMQEKRRRKRIAFGNWYDTTLTAIDGTWSLKAKLHDISDSGAKLHTDGEVTERVRNEEFFLMITPDGKVSRRAKMVWRDGSHIGIHFVTAPCSPPRKNL
jgi:hypothetical protein